MAISQVRTLLPLDEYARIMAIPGWVFNQMNHPVQEKRGCEDVLLQSGYTGDPNQLTGRDEIAMAISMAERKIADFLGFWPTPTWVIREQHSYATQSTTHLPLLHTNWGWLISAGTEAWERLAAGVTVNYVDEDGDGVNEQAYLTIATTVDPCELAVVPPGRNPMRREWRIRPLTWSTPVAGTVGLHGYSWLFTDPDLWLTTDDGTLGNAANHLATVDVYRHYNKTFPTQAQYQWLPGANECSTNATCTPVCQSACVVVSRERVGQFYARPATWSGGAWNNAHWAGTGLPDELFIWYYSGYRDPTRQRCETMGQQLKTAIVRLANCYLPEIPCGCEFANQRWANDREEMPMNAYDVALAQSAFGTTMRGAIWARAVCASIPPLGQGG